MDRRSFLRNIGFGSVGVVLSPLISFEPPKRMIYKVTSPVFELWHKKTGESGFEAKHKIVFSVTTYRGTLKKLCDRYPNDEIFFYQEVVVTDNKEVNSNYVRARVIPKEPNWEIADSKFYKPMYV